MELICIVPNFAPARDGIGDYALSFARALYAEAGVHARFIVANPSWSGEARVEEFPVSHLPARSASDLLDLLTPVPAELPATLLLHYEGYGYANRGCPFWLVQALEEWRGGGHGRQLITVFHELYAFGAPWTSAFWLSSVQKSLAMRLAHASDQWMTSVDRYAAIVRGFVPKSAARAYSLPVFSSIGESDGVPPLVERQRRLVVFGTRGRRLEVYKRSAADLNRLCERLGITEILDIGRPIEFDFARTLTRPVVTCGELSRAEVGRLLLDAVAGVIDYPASMLGKSTIFAAYCAHRLIPFVASFGDSSAADGLERGRHYWLTNDEAWQLDIEAGQAIADNAFSWYQTHNLSTHVKMLEACLVSAKQPSPIQKAVQTGK